MSLCLNLGLSPILKRSVRWMETHLAITWKVRLRAQAKSFPRLNLRNKRRVFCRHVPRIRSQAVTLAATRALTSVHLMAIFSTSKGRWYTRSLSTRSSSSMSTSRKMQLPSLSYQQIRNGNKISLKNSMLKSATTPLLTSSPSMMRPWSWINLVTIARATHQWRR